MQQGGMCPIKRVHLMASMWPSYVQEEVEVSLLTTGASNPLTLVDNKYCFLWVHVSCSWSSSRSQRLNQCVLSDKIEGGFIGFPKPQVSPDKLLLPPFLLADDAFLLKPWLMRTCVDEACLYILFKYGFI